MPTESRAKSWTPWWPERRRRLRPFQRLVEHFLHRLLRGGQEEGSDFELGAGALLGLLAAPGALATMFMLEEYSSFLNWLRGQLHRDLLVASAPDKYLFLALTMGVTGIVTVLKWDRILPDTQDYLNLAPLPVRANTVLLANTAAIAFAVVVFLVDVNAIPTLLFPFIVTAAAEAPPSVFLWFAATHAAVTALAGLFTFCAVFSALGILAALLPRRLFNAMAAGLRGALLVAFLAMLFSAPAGRALLKDVNARPSSLPAWLPPVWFTALYQEWQGRGTAVYRALAHRALVATSVASLLMALSYAASYRRRFAAVLEGAARQSKPRLASALLWVLDRFAPAKAGFGRASHRFAVRALLRSEPHRLAIAVAVGLGGWLAVQEAAAGRWLQAPLLAAYLLILGLRVAFEIPALLSANWIFRAMVEARSAETHPVARRVMLAFVSLCVLLPWFAAGVWRAGLFQALLGTAYVAALSVCLIELLLEGYRKMPLACPMPGFRDNLPSLFLLYLVGFEFFSVAGSALGAWMLDAPLRLLLLPAAMATAWQCNLRRRNSAREAGELAEGLTFESLPHPAVERLDLSGAG
jgi:hypothetical protein